MGAAALKEKAGFPIHSLREQFETVERGYPLNYALELINLICSGNAALKHRIISPATITRHKQVKDRPLKKDLSERIARIERVWSRALAIYKGDTEAASDFLRRPHVMLEDRSPLDVALQGETGAAYLSSVLDTIEYGFAA